MKISLYLDEDSQESDLVKSLRFHQVDVLSSAVAGMNGSVDPVQLEYAITLGRVIYTFNARDFYRLHTEGCPSKFCSLLAASAATDFRQAFYRLESQAASRVAADRGLKSTAKVSRRSRGANSKSFAQNFDAHPTRSIGQAGKFHAEIVLVPRQRFSVVSKPAAC